jgi:outer membrane biosynthesis protein TonB
MKKSFFLSLALVAMVAVSCEQGSEEVTEAESLTGDSTAVEEVVVDTVVETEFEVDSTTAE